MGFNFTDLELMSSTREAVRDIDIKSIDTLSYDDLIYDLAVTSKNEVRFPIAKAHYLEFNYANMSYEDRYEPMYDIETLRRTRVRVHKTAVENLFTNNKQKYIDNEFNVTSNFMYFGHKNLGTIQQYQKSVEQQQNYLTKHNYIEIIVSHKDCGYPYRGHPSESLARNYADYICDGENDTEILQSAINSHPGRNIIILLLEDEYKLKPSSGSGTEKDPYICLNINRDNLIIRTCDRRTNITFDNSITNRENALLFKTNGHSFDLSTINLCMDELDYIFEEYTYPEPTDQMMEIKKIVESTDPLIKTYTRAEVIKLIQK